MNSLLVPFSIKSPHFLDQVFKLLAYDFSISERSWISVDKSVHSLQWWEKMREEEEGRRKRSEWGIPIDKRRGDWITSEVCNKFTCIHPLSAWWFAYSCRAPKTSRSQPAANRPSDATSSLNLNSLSFRRERHGDWTNITEIEIFICPKQVLFRILLPRWFLRVDSCCVHFFLTHSLSTVLLLSQPWKNKWNSFFT